MVELLIIARVHLISLLFGSQIRNIRRLSTGKSENFENTLKSVKRQGSKLRVVIFNQTLYFCIFIFSFEFNLKSEAHDRLS